VEEAQDTGAIADREGALRMVKTIRRAGEEQDALSGIRPALNPGRR
jgi:hypothetical protein